MVVLFIPQFGVVMSARHKINALVFCGILVVSGAIGLVTGSGWAFALATIGLVIAASASGDIRVR
jgi:hypothetical protein